MMPDTPALVLTDDPLEALAENDRHRGAPGADGNAGLWTVDQWAAALRPAGRQFRFGAPTFAPAPWPKAEPVGQAEYSARFAAEFPAVAAILPIAHVYVAGGAAAWPLGPATARAGDVDLFIAGIDPADRAALWGKAAEVVGLLRRALAGGRPEGAADITETLTPGLITLTARYAHGTRRGHKVQVILRAFPHISAILHGFDVPACCVAYDGRAARLTYLAAWAHAFRVNVVCPAYRSTTYERRLLKYFGRGYALALPHLRRGALAEGVPLRLPHLVLRPQAVQGLYATGTAELPPGEAPPLSDYDPIEDDLWGYAENEWVQARSNLRELISGKGRYAVTALYECGQPGGETGLPLALYATAEPPFGEVLPRAAFDRMVAGAAGAVVHRGLINIAALSRIFRLNAAEISRFAAAVHEVLASRPDCRIDVSRALGRSRDALVAAYEATPAEVGWWIVDDPSRQYTASLNPRVEEPELWYGAALYGAAAPPSAEELTDTLLAAFEWRRGGAVFGGPCAICQGPVVRGDANSVILACGHLFHWSGGRGRCAGLHAWASGHDTCPTCRRGFDAPPPPPPALPPAPLLVDIEW
jgi:hypothetical protein